MLENSSLVHAGIVELAVPYRDTAAQSLCWSLGLPVKPALAMRSVGIGSLILELRLLGASHQMIVWDADGGTPLCVETVACLSEMTEPMPSRCERSIPSGRYAWTAERLSRDEEGFTAAVEQIRRDVAANPEALAGCYPGSRDAITAILPEPMSGGVRWTTWHTYPQQLSLVRTTAAVAPWPGGGASS